MLGTKIRPLLISTILNKVHTIAITLSFGNAATRRLGHVRIVYPLLRHFLAAANLGASIIAGYVCRPYSSALPNGAESTLDPRRCVLLH